MTNTTQSALDALSEKATQGEWGVDLQYADNGGRYLEIANSSYDVVIGEYGVGEDDAEFIVALVNAYRTGHLTVADPAAIAAAEARSRAAERADVVRYLRQCEAIHNENADRKGQIQARKHHADACHFAAMAIEAGEHLAKLEGGQ